MVEILSLSLMMLMMLIFFSALLHKLSDIAQFQGYLADYKILPEVALKPVSWILFVLESGIVLAILWPNTRVFAIGLAVGLLSLYAVAIAINLWRGRTHIECGCGGAVQTLSAALLWRNGILIVLAIVPLLHMPADLAGGEISAAVFAGLFWWLMYQFFEQSNINWQLQKAIRKPL